MSRERQVIASHLQELLKLVEDPESDIEEIRLWTDAYWWRRGHFDEIHEHLRQLERQIESIRPTRCALGEGEQGEAVIHLITGIEGRLKEERKHISSWLVGAENLTVVDPYFFSFGGPNKVFRTQAAYLDALFDLLPKSLKTLEVFHLPGPNRKIYDSFRDHCHRRQIHMKNWETTEVHDRVLIKSESEAKALGTSFGGYGNKIAFVLDLPQADLESFRRELVRIKQPV